MGRFVFLSALLVAAALTYLFMHYYQDAYKVLPVTHEINRAKAPVNPWVDFKSPSGRFQVRFPVQPQHATEKMVDPRTKEVRLYDMYAAENGLGSVYMISLITFEEVDTPEEEAQLLTSTMNDMVGSSKNNVLKTMHMGTFQDHKALNFTIENGDVQIQATAFIIDRVLYALTCVSNKISNLSTEFDYFLNSFQLTPQGNIKTKEQGKKQ